MSYLRSRSRLHLTKLDEFAAFCESRGWTRAAPIESAYEVLRLHRPGEPAVLVYKKRDAKEHATIFGNGTKLFNAYIREKKAK